MKPQEAHTMAKNVQNDELTTALTNLLAALGGGNAATPTAVAEATKTAKAKAAPAVEEVAPQDELIEKLGIRYGKGATVLTAEAVKAAARVLKSGNPEAIAKDEGNGSHVVLFRTEKGNVRVQNAYTPKA